MKGGILLALKYHGDRYTRDVDFSLRETAAEIDAESLVQELADALPLQVEALPYGLDCRIQSHELRPPELDKSFQTLQLSIGYAPKSDTSRHQRLLRKHAVHTLSVDISFNEQVTAVEVLPLDGAGSIGVYGLADLVAEKYRAMLQQPMRKRVRRQDVYDLFRLLDGSALAGAEIRQAVIKALRTKSEGRGLVVGRESLRDPEVISRSRQEYPQLQDEIESVLPEFALAYQRVRHYYESLPWDA